MWKFGDLAIRSIERLKMSPSIALEEAYAREAEAVFPDRESLQTKNCPRAAFFGLCETGVVIGVPEGNYNASPENRNKQHVLAGLKRLTQNPELADEEPRVLWELTMGTEQIAHNNQMHVLLTLWRNGYINRDRATKLLLESEK